MRYTINEGVRHQQLKIKKILIAGAASLGVLGVAATPAIAASGGSQATYCGATHGAFADVNGNFGFLGAAGGTPGYHGGAVGQQVGATGSNNSSVDCSPQN